MNPISPALAPTPLMTDRLTSLVAPWSSSPRGGDSPTLPAELAELRTGLNAIALEAEGEAQGGLARALRRIAVLSEIWECLECEPDQAEAATEVRAFCLEAIDHLVCGQPAGISGDPAVCEEIVRRSDECWGIYLGQVDPGFAAQPGAAEPESFEDAVFTPDDAPPELDQATLLRLLQGTTPSASEAPHPEIHSKAISAPPSDRRAVAGPVETPHGLGIEIPPLPTRLDFDDEIREAFLADATELFERIERIVIGLVSQNDHTAAILELSRSFHTLKGAAGSVGLRELSTLIHELEERLRQAGGKVSPELNDSLHQVVGYLEELIGLIRRGPTRIPNPPAIQEVRTVPVMVSDRETNSVGATATPHASGLEAIAPHSALSPDPSEIPAPASGRATAPSAAEGPIRVPAARFDELTELASDLIVQGRYWLSQAETIKSFATTLQDCRNRLLGSLDRLHGIAFRGLNQGPATPASPGWDDPAQLGRMEEQVDDLAVLAATAHAVAAPMAERGDTLVRLSRRFWDLFQSLRLVPIQGLFQRLARVVHEAAKVEGRQVDVVMKGEETGVDRAVQDKAFEPLLHVVRNAVGHGIEPPDDRIHLGKPAAGRITLEARREGNTLLIVVEDDGKGLDDDAILGKARQLGWLGPEEHASTERLHAFLFQPGFSTRSQANAISGRGVGMDVVAREVEHLRGTIDLASRPGRGTRLTIRLPARLALEPALIVRVAGQPFAVPASQVEHAQLFELPSTDVSHGEAGSDRAGNPPTEVCVAYRDRSIPVVFACEILGIGRSPGASWPKLVIVRAGCGPIGLVVDTIERAEDLVIKPLGALLAGHPLVSGTSTSISGEVISVLHSSGLERWLNDHKASAAYSARGEQSRFAVAAEERGTALVVDDSISVRRGLARQLGEMGLKVQEASDGLEALGRLRDCRYSLVVTDLEMPKLDGFALLAEIKRSPRLATIPVIVASTRCDPVTRRRVRELGAQGLLSKPVDPQELTRVVEPHLGAVGG